MGGEERFNFGPGGGTQIVPARRVSEDVVSTEVIGENVLQDTLTPIIGPPNELNNRQGSGVRVGRMVDSIPPPLLVVFRPSVQPYMIS